MNRLLLLLLVLGAVLIGVVWLSLSSRETGRGPAARAEAAISQEAATTQSEPLAPARTLEPETDTEQASTLEPSAAPATTPARETVASSFEEELARAHWVEGRVCFPEGTPADEQLFVIAQGKDFENGKDHRVPVEHDGRFRVAFSERSKSGWLLLEGRYLYLEQNFRWKRDEGGGPVVLEPKLGGRIAGRLVPPEGVRPEQVGGMLQFSGAERRPVEVRGDLAFEFGGLPAVDRYTLSYAGEALIGKGVETRVEPGVTKAIELELRRGATLSGRVVDEAGAALVGAKVQSSLDDADSWWDVRYRIAESDLDGSFRLQGLPAGKTSLRAWSRGYEVTRQELGHLSEGEVREGVELVLRQGNAIAGRILWPDGSGAGTTLQIESESAEDVGPEGLSSRGPDPQSAEDGRFRITGLGQGPFRVRAQRERTEELVELSKVLGSQHKRNETTTWKALAEHVEPGTSDLVLMLSPGLELSGRVVDDLGAPLADYRFMGSRLASHGEGRMSSGDFAGRDFRDTDGSFQLEGLIAGEWELRFSSKGHVSSGAVRCTVPATEVLEIVLPRAARVRGSVVDANGAPVSGALVEPGPGQADDFSSFSGSRDENGKTDERGAFVLGGLSPGATTLIARAVHLAPSSPLGIELAPGEERSDIVLRLQHGCRITGEVVDQKDQPVAGVHVQVSSSNSYLDTETDSKGEFALEGVSPGEIVVWAETEIRLEKRLTLADGETARVHLAPPGQLVRMHGRALAGGEPLARATINTQPQGSEGIHVSAECDEAGAFELTLPGAGRYWVGAWAPSIGMNLWNTIDVPAVEDFPCDIAFAVGRISGLVTGEDGRPIAGLTLETEQDSAGAYSSGFGRATTDENGRYELRVPAGTYTVKAGGEPSGESDVTYVAARAAEIIVAPDAHVRGIDFTLLLGGGIQGRVRLADGTLANGAILWGGPAGISTESAELGRTDERGHYRIAGVPKSAMSLTGTSGSQIADWVHVHFEPGKVQEIDFELRQSTWLAVRVVDARGAPVDAQVVAFDPQGHDYSPIIDPQGTRSFGPYPAGTYRLRATLGPQSIERTVVLTGTQERLDVELVLE